MNDLTILNDEYIPQLNRFTGKLELLNIHTGDILESEAGNLVYTEELAYAICDEVREGKTLKQIAEMSSMPPLRTLLKWKRHNSNFKKLYDEARKDRGEMLHDEVFNLLESMEHLAKDEVPATKLKIDTLLKLAEKADPEQYNPKPQALQNTGGSNTIVIITGIDRDLKRVEEIYANQAQEIDWNRIEKSGENSSNKPITTRSEAKEEVYEVFGAEVKGLEDG